jgi:hypothetical protein
MRTIASAALIATAVTTASQAGTYSEPELEPVVIVEDAAESSAPSAPLVLALTTVIVLGTALGQ